MREKSFRHSVTVSAAILGGFALAATVGVVLLVRDIKTRTEDLAAKRRELAAIAASLESFVALEGESKKAEAYAARIEAILQTRDELIPISRIFGELAKNRSVDFGFTFGSDEAGTDTKPPRLNFTMTAAGSFPNLVKFFQDLEREKPLLSIASLNLTGGEGGRLNAVVRGGLFYRSLAQ